ncbi:hypothetical protein [Clostridium taeniosporum]|uniref:Uncharacterized protein n=1 Tax=Clostridium taeniosporum TaxID=394958 RepID=A0A1D7XNB3_9CLOT|nr:hypothetical protein [Clostridium taeniosporum]AOR24833.1 hypothetical protein BGI42_14350 [Clostridium taeniosporum]
MLNKIKSLINEIEINNKVINEKSSILLNSKITEIMEIVSISRKHLVYEKIENIVRFSPNTKFSNLTSFNNLCKHAIKVGEYKSGSKNVKCYMNEKPGLYELWLLWNNEFCVTHVNYISDKNVDESIYEREVTDYGRCAFKMYENEFIWDMDGIMENIMKNLEKNSNYKKSIRNLLESQLK